MSVDKEKQAADSSWRCSEIGSGKTSVGLSFLVKAIEDQVLVSTTSPEDLPLLINHDWSSKYIESYYIEKIKNYTKQ